MAQNFLPANDLDFNRWLSTFNSYVAAHTAALGLAAADVTPLTGLRTAYTAALDSHIDSQRSAQSARQGKDDARAAAENAVRALVRRIQAFPSVTDTQRRDMGITVRDGEPTAVAASARTVAHRPVGVVDTSQRLRHEIRFYDVDTPTKRAKPPGVLGCEIWAKLAPAGTPAPSDEVGMTLLGLDTASPYVAEFEGGDAGKTAFYMLRWVTSKGEKGPWSETVAATIGG